MMRLVILAIGVMLISCTFSPYEMRTSVRFRYPSVDIYGPATSQFTVDDVRQITELMRPRSDILKPIDQIDAKSPNEAHVSSGKAQNTGDRMSEFEVQKKNGRWEIKKGSAYTAEIFVTS